MANITKIKGRHRGYVGMTPSKWPDIHPDDQAIHDRLYAALVDKLWMSNREVAAAHRLIHQLLERKS